MTVVVEQALDEESEPRKDRLKALSDLEVNQDPSNKIKGI